MAIVYYNAEKTTAGEILCIDGNPNRAVDFLLSQIGEVEASLSEREEFFNCEGLTVLDLWTALNKKLEEDEC